MTSQQRQLIRKLQRAINNTGKIITYNTSQFYSEHKKKLITMYTITEIVKDEESGSYRRDKLFTTATEIQVLLFLRDYWYELNGKEVTKKDNLWEDNKNKYLENSKDPDYYYRFDDKD